MMQHTLATPVIEVAKDGKTAKGVWMSPGHEARVLGGRLTALWVWGTYGEDFIKEDGRWKIRNHHVYLNIITPFEVPWTAPPRRRPRRHRRHLPARPAGRVQARTGPARTPGCTRRRR